jgi:hypothetical protein
MRRSSIRLWVCWVLKQLFSNKAFEGRLRSLIAFTPWLSFASVPHSPAWKAAD